MFAQVYANFGNTYTNVNIGGFNDPLGSGNGTVASEWSSDNSTVLSVSGELSGGALTPASSGTAGISVTLYPLTATTNLTVVSGEPDYQLLQNASFELPGTQKINWGFSPYGTNTYGVTDWANAQTNNGSNYTDDGVESATPAVGSWAAYCRAGDGGAYQIANYQINNGDTFYLIWSAEHTGGSTGASTEQVTLLSAAATNTFYTNCVSLDSDSSILPGTGSSPGGYTNIFLVYQATANDAGNYVGVFFNNASAAGNNYVGFDNFILAVTPLAAAPNAPIGLKATGGTGSVTLSWAATGGASGYYVKRSTTSGTEATVTLVATNAYTDTAVIGGVKYYYVVSATNVFGGSLNSSEVSAIPAATYVPNPTVSWSGAQLMINWSSGYLLESTNVMGPWVAVPAASAPSYVVTNSFGTRLMFYRISSLP
jgi:hypothetical protein